MALRKDALLDSCPKCKAVGSLRRSRSRSAYEKIIKSTGIFSLFRCRECGWRGIKTYVSFHTISWKRILFYIGLVLVSAYIIRYLLKRFIL